MSEDVQNVNSAEESTSPEVVSIQNTPQENSDTSAERQNNQDNQQNVETLESAEDATESSNTSAEQQPNEENTSSEQTPETSSEAEETEEEKAESKSQREKLAAELQNLTKAAAANSLLFFAPNLDEIAEQAKAEREARREALEAERRQRRLAEITHDEEEVISRRRRRRRRGEVDIEIDGGTDGDPENTVTKVRAPRLSDSHSTNRVTGVRGSTRLEAKKIRRRESRHSGRRQRGISEAEFLARRESVDRQMVVRQKDDRIQIGVLEDGVLAEHFVSKTQQDSLIGNVYLGKVQNVLPSMEAAFVDIGRGRNAVLYAGEVNWDVSGLDGSPRKIENALKSGDSVLVQVTKDPVGHKGARLTSQVSLPGRFLVYVPGGSMTGISRKLPDTERTRLKKILKNKLPDGAGVIVRTAAEGASEEELSHDINRLRVQWEEIQNRASAPKTLAPEMLYQEPDLTIKTVRDVFNEDFTAMMVQGDVAWDSIEAYVTYMAPDLVDRLQKWDKDEDLFDHYRIEEQLFKALDRKVYLPSGGSLVIDRTEAMTVVDVNTGKFTGSGGNLEETVTKNNLEAAEEIVRQLRLRDIGGIIVIDFIDMVLESNRDLVLRRLVECLGRDRTKHQVAEVTSLGLVQMTRKRMGTGLLEVFSEPCEECAGRGVIVHDQPLKGRSGGASDYIHRHDRDDRRKARKSQRNRDTRQHDHQVSSHEDDNRQSEARRVALANIAAASTHEPEKSEADDSRESKNARKRKRRKQNRREQTPQDQQSSNEQFTGTPDLTVTIGGEVIELPQREESKETEDTTAEQGSLTLESLTEAFDQKEKKGRSRKRRSDSSAQPQSAKSAEESDVSDSSSSSADVDSRFTQNSDRFEAIRAGEARARASQKAGREVVRSENENGDAESSAQRTERSRSSRDTAEKPLRNSRGRRAISQPQGENSPHNERQAQKKPRVSGVAQPGSVNGTSEPSVVETVAQQPAEPVQKTPAKKRRSRRAVSTGVDGNVQSQEIQKAEAAGTVVSTSMSVASSTENASAPVMLGVGVSAEEIKREGK